MKEIPLTQGYSAIVDDELFEELNQHKWHAHVMRDRPYAWRETSKGGIRKRIAMHRHILGIDDSSILVDHKDRNTLNNLKSNLRIATRTQNGANRRSHLNSTSKYLGVSLQVNKYKDKSYSYWQANIKTNGKCVALGMFKTEAEAALAYNNAAIKSHGEFANLNVIES